MTALPDWLAATWRERAGRIEQLPHGVLIGGPPGVGKRLLADALAARLLCSAARGAAPACGECPSCRLRLSGNHPDAHVLVPEASLETDDEAPSSKSARKPSLHIVIEQIRALQGALEITSHMGGRRTVVIDPAEAMNPFTANALLKLLEEPPAGTHLLLVSAHPQRLLPTLRSRCQQWAIAAPAAAQAKRWLADNASADAAAVLELVGGLPLEAARLAERGGAAALERFVADLGRLGQGEDAVEVAGRWEAWCKSKEGAASGVGMPRLSDWVQRWAWDLAAVGANTPSRYFPAQRELMARICSGRPMPQLLDCYNEISQVRRSASHPLNLRLALEDMLMRYQRCVSGGKTR